MKVVIQCAGRKQAGAGQLKDEAGAEVSFVAHPDLYPHSSPVSAPFRPDDLTDPVTGTTWRDVLVRYNKRFQQEGANPDRLLPASELYSPQVYQDLTDSFGTADVYILSAGWGLVRADFLLPYYNITFSIQRKVPLYARRGQRDDSWWDFNHLRDARVGSDEPVHFFGGRDYLRLYYQLAGSLPGHKVIHHKSDPPRQMGYAYEAYVGLVNQNWQYLAAKAFIRTQLGETT